MLARLVADIGFRPECRRTKSSLKRPGGLNPEVRAMRAPRLLVDIFAPISTFMFHWWALKMAGQLRTGEGMFSAWKCGHKGNWQQFLYVPPHNPLALPFTPSFGIFCPDFTSSTAKYFTPSFHVSEICKLNVPEKFWAFFHEWKFWGYERVKMKQ